MTRRPLWPVLVAAAAGLAILLALGVWQVNRLAWKNALLAEVERTMAGPALPLDLANAAAIAELQKYKLTGHYAETPPLRMIATLKGGPGWRLLHPFVAADGASLLVDRGVAPENAMPPAPSGEVEITGLVRRHASGQGLFDPPNTPATNHWYWWEWPALLQALPQQAAPTATFTLELLPGQPGTEGMFVEAPKAGLRNNHLGYAITWFGLAAVLAVMTTVFITQQKRRPLEAPPAQD